MGSTKTIRRNDIEIMRFLSSIIIMIFHGYYYGLGYSKHIMGGGWIFVELFFLLTGYFTAAHFIEQTNSYIGEGDSAYVAVKYTLHKFKTIYYYFFVALTGTYLFSFAVEVKRNASLIKVGLTYAMNYVQELLLLYATDFCKSKMGTGWYVSALFWMLPIVVFLIIRFKGTVCYLISGIVPIVFYVKRGVVKRQGGFDDLERAFCALLLGVFLYSVVSLIKANYEEILQKKICKWLLVFITITGYMCSIYFVINARNTSIKNSRFVLLLFFVILTSIFIRNTKSTNNRISKIINYLGALSLPIYLFQLLAGMICKVIVNRHMVSYPVSIITYIAVTIVLSVAAKAFYDWREKTKHLSN